MIAMRSAKKNVLPCLTVLAFGFVGCQTARSPARPTNSRIEVASDPGVNKAVAVSTMQCGEFIRRVAAGEDFSGQEMNITGVALNDTESGLVNVGARDAYKSKFPNNFISVYEVPRHVQAGAFVRFKVRVETSRAITTKGFVLIDTEYVVE